MHNYTASGKSASRLIVLGCSSTKYKTVDQIPAVSLYDGPAFRVLRSYLRRHRWPSQLSVAILSAEHGLIGALAPIAYYDVRMTQQRARELTTSVTAALGRFAPGHARLELILGRTYLESIDLDDLAYAGKVSVAGGPIGMKLSHLHDVLHALPRQPRTTPQLDRYDRPLYFLPDWDDFLDVKYDFDTDSFSSPQRAERGEQHSIAMMRPDRICDGVLISLAQNVGSKGLLRRVGKQAHESLAPKSIREKFALRADQWAFGDCGAFSYVADESPTISVEQAVSLYQLYDFDFGASVDHIPVEEIPTASGWRTLSDTERRQRVKLTRRNADDFMTLHKRRKCTFTPVGVIQGIKASEYGRQLGEYTEMGYEYVALGGLVPRHDADVLDIVESVARARDRLRYEPQLHLLGVFRPELQERFRALRIRSFDSATYFRKAWLRSSQNYLSVDGQWYAAIRVPPSHDPRTLKRLQAGGATNTKIRRLEQSALKALRDFAGRRLPLEPCLAAVLAYDALLDRPDFKRDVAAAAYRHTLAARPWEACSCTMCASLGVDVVIFRGLNRNKRRGAHNTLQLFQRIRRS